MKTIDKSKLGRETIIECKDLSFSWQDENVLANLNFSLNRGEFAVIVGGNGAGKSTLMRLLLNEITANSGEILLFGQLISSFAEWTRIAYLPQDAVEQNKAFPTCVFELVKGMALHRRRKEKMNRSDSREVVMDSLKQLGMEKFANSMIYELSGGQQQRVLLAGVIASGPELMLLDEPTSGIDYENRLSLFHLLQHMREELGMSIMMITHDTAMALKFADRCFCLEGGSIHELSPQEHEMELEHQHSHPELEELRPVCYWRAKTEDQDV